MPSRFLRSARALAFLAALFASRSAAAAPSEGAALFATAKGLYDQGNFTEACGLLEKSDRLEPMVGTLGLLASCHEKLGRVATARREFLETAERARAAGDPRESFARDQASALES